MLRGDRSVWFACAACAGAASALHPIPAVLAITIPLVYFVLARAPLLAIIAAALFSLSAFRADAELRTDAAGRAAMANERWPRHCDIEGRVVRSPVQLGDALRVDVDPDRGTCFLGRATLLVDAATSPTLARGDRVVASATLAPPNRFVNAARDLRAAQARRGVLLSGAADTVSVVEQGRGILAVIDRLRDQNRRRITATFPVESAAMARALVLGEDDLTADDQRAFRQSGLAHLLAVSGMHLVLVVATFVALLRAVLVRIPAIALRTDCMRIAAALGVPLAFAYAELAGGSGSAKRAAWMMSVAFAARAFARRSEAWRALGLSVLVMIAIDPLAPFDLSFVLSALATLGLLGLARPIEGAMAERAPRLPRFILRSLAASIAATITCAPVLAGMSAGLPLGGLIANVIAVPVGEAAALPLCLAHAALAEWPAAEHGCAIAAAGALGIVRGIARLFTFGVLAVPPPTAMQAATIAGSSAGFVLGRFPGRWLAIGVVATLGLELVARREGAPSSVLRVTYLDVAQGDAALVDLPDGQAILIDGGGIVGSPVDVGERVIAPTLAARRRARIDVVVLSHPHPDHFLGLRAGLERMTVGEIWDTGQGEAEGVAGAYAELLRFARTKGVPIRRPAELCGTRVVGGAVIEVLAPCPPNLDRGPNDNSFVFRIRYGRRAFLFVGDAERTEEGELVASGHERLRADVLKVGHHGSRTSSTPAFLEAVKPSVAVISCGVRNRFGHPHPNTLHTLAASGVRVLRTDHDGAIVATTDGETLDVGPELAPP